jgi:CBS domain-containing protein
MIETPVSAAATRSPPTVSPDTTTVEAARRLRQPDVPALVVLDSAERVVGIVTQSDIVALVAEGGGDRPVASYMSTAVVTTAPSTPVDVAADRMREAGVANLPVVEGGAYRGLLTREDLRPYVSRHRLAIEWTGEPLTLDAPVAHVPVTE